MHRATFASDNQRRLQADEFDADYFEVQYLYKSGYEPECYLRFVSAEMAR
jgi:predicted Zn-dependent protease